jgi:probable O-glycosylation ligase (exosortase A-associated)
MRDFLLLALLLVPLAATLRYPFVGVLTWAWFSLMTPHQMAYGVFGVPLNFVIAATTILAVTLSGGWRQFRFDATTGLVLFFAFWLCISQIFSLDRDSSYTYFDRFVKTLVFAFLCLQLATDKLRFHALLWMFVIGIGYFALKGGLFTIVTLGQYRVQGLERTILEDNNHMGVALATILPLILYLREQASRRLVRLGLLGLFAADLVAILGTHSRGAFIALIVFGGFLWLRSRRKLAILAGLGLILIPAIAFMPAKWTERMSTISEATKDASFMARVDAWVINMKLAAEHPLTGAGLRNSYRKEIAQAVDPIRANRARAAHSIYFEMLGGAGYVGLAIYLALLGGAFLGAVRLSASKRDSRIEPWIPSFGYHAQIALAVFCVGGAAVSIEMWDGYWILIALIGAAAKLAREPALAGEAPIPSLRAGWRMAARGRGGFAPRPKGLGRL